MQNLCISLLLSLVVCSLWCGSLAEDQCDSFCFNELRPLLNRVANGQHRGTTRNPDNKIKAKLDRLVDQQAKLEGQILAGQTNVEAKLEENLLAVQTKLESQQAVLIKMENQLQAILKKMETMTTIPPGFERVGSRYFRVFHEDKDWETAEIRCREMGGYLASFRNTEEITALRTKLQAREECYWLGLNDHETEGHFVSVASNKTAQLEYLTWVQGTPIVNINRNCVILYGNQIWDLDCKSKMSFIYQADNET